MQGGEGFACRPRVHGPMTHGDRMMNTNYPAQTNSARPILQTPSEIPRAGGPISLQTVALCRTQNSVAMSIMTAPASRCQGLQARAVLRPALGCARIAQIARPINSHCARPSPRLAHGKIVVCAAASGATPAPEPKASKPGLLSPFSDPEANRRLIALCTGEGGESPVCCTPCALDRPAPVGVAGLVPLIPRESHAVILATPTGASRGRCCLPGVAPPRSKPAACPLAQPKCCAPWPR